MHPMSLRHPVALNAAAHVCVVYSRVLHGQLCRSLPLSDMSEMSEKDRENTHSNNGPGLSEASRKKIPFSQSLKDEDALLHGIKKSNSNSNRDNSKNKISSQLGSNADTSVQGQCHSERDRRAAHLNEVVEKAAAKKEEVQEARRKAEDVEKALCEALQQLGNSHRHALQNDSGAAAAAAAAAATAAANSIETVRRLEEELAAATCVRVRVRVCERV